MAERQYRIERDELTGEAVVALLAHHLAEMHRISPPEHCHAMPVERLREPDVTFWSAWDGDTLACVGALKELDAAHGEIKSMRVAADYAGQGAGQAMLLHIMAEARARGYRRLSLETGKQVEFVPAQRLYEKHGFAVCPPFADYSDNAYSLCMARDL